MIYKHSFNGVTAETGDILFTHDGEVGSVFGEFWRLIGRIFPSEYSHCAMYLGPGIRFVESAAKGVVVVEMEGDTWNGIRYGKERLLVDTLIGVGDPIAGRGISRAQEKEIRENVVAYCLEQAAESKPYNINFFNPETDGAFYCSQLIYKAYQTQGINLHAQLKQGAEALVPPIVFPEEMWNACLKKARVPDDAVKL